MNSPYQFTGYVYGSLSSAIHMFMAIIQVEVFKKKDNLVFSSFTEQQTTILSCTD